MPRQHSYDLNLTPGATFDPLASKSILNFAPVTPDKSLRGYNKDGSEIQNLDVHDIADQEREKQKNKITTKMVSINELNSVKESRRPARDSLAAADPTELQENQNPDQGDGLSKTPQQKQRRKKHRPKVITEGKPRTPKPVTPKPPDSNNNPTGKRKYVRKNKAEKVSETPPEVVGHCNDSQMLAPNKKSCRKALNFEEMQPNADDSRYCSSNVSADPQVHHYYTRRALSKSTIQLCHELEVVMAGKTPAGTVHEICSTHEMEESYMFKCATETVRKSVPVKTNSPLVKMNVHIQEESKDVQVTAHVHRDTSAQVLFERDTHPCPMSPNDSDCSSVNLTEGKEQAEESKRDYHSAVKQADTGSSNMSGTHYNCLQTYLSFWPHNKRKRTDKGQGQNNTASSTTYWSTAKDFGEVITVYPQNDTKDNPCGSKTSNLISPQSNRNKVLDKTNAECIIMASLPNETPTKKRSRSATRARDLASLTRIPGHNIGGPCSTKPPVGYKNAERVENFHRPDPCFDALIKQTRATLARKRRSQKRNSPAVQNLAFQHNQQSYSKLSGTLTKKQSCCLQAIYYIFYTQCVDSCNHLHTYCRCSSTRSMDRDAFC